MWVFTVAIPADAPAAVFDLVRGFFGFLRGLISAHGVNGVVFHEGPEGQK